MLADELHAALNLVLKSDAEPCLDFFVFGEGLPEFSFSLSENLNLHVQELGTALVGLREDFVN